MFSVEFPLCLSFVFVTPKYKTHPKSKQIIRIYSRQFAQNKQRKTKKSWVPVTKTFAGTFGGNCLTYILDGYQYGSQAILCDC